MDIQTFVFFFLSAILVFASLRVITARNPVHAALHLILAFFTCGGIWALLQAEFLAIAIILVYVGAVMVLFLFVVMMLDINIERMRVGFWRYLPLGGMIGAVVVWLVTQGLIETAQESSPGIGWQVPLGSDVVLCYVVGRWVFGAGHPALHILLLLTIAMDILGLLLAGVADPESVLRLSWLLLPVLASAGVWRINGKRADLRAPERMRRKGLMLWPYIVAGALSYLGVAAAGLPAALGLLPVIPAIPHADRSFGLFAEAEEFLHDPLNRLAHLLVRPLAAVLFLFGLTRGGIDMGAYAPTTLCVLAALWIGKPLGVFAGMLIAGRLSRTRLRPQAGLGLREQLLIAVITGIGFTVPILATETALPGGKRSPRVIMTTAPEEQHVIGLLMVEAILTLESAECIPLGTQMPLLEIARATEAHQADIAALSFSTAFPQRQIPGLLQQLRMVLPATTGLWVGGAGVARLAKQEGVLPLHSFDDAIRALADWRTAHATISKN